MTDRRGMTGAPPHGPVLALDASTVRATLAIVESRAVVATADVAERSEHVEPLLPAMLRLLDTASLSLDDLTAIVCGAGPGVFTGLRTAASVAKGLAMGLSIPLYAVPSLSLILAECPPGHYVAVLDAGRGDRFVSSPNGYSLVPATDLADLGATLVGPQTGAWPHARAVVRLDWGAPVDLASWEPDYGRDSAAVERRRAGATR
jgi:tRNA threonylcarbamoyl adenosine modification protein YeaZ